MLGELSGSPIIFLFIFQFITCIIGISFFYKFFNLEKKLWHIPLYTPFIALLSVRWPDAIVATLLIIIAYYFKESLRNHSKKYAIISGLLFGLLLNFRSEYLGLLFALAVIAIVSLFRDRKLYFNLFVLTILSTLFMLLPWAYYSYSINKHIHLAATNGGGVLYISLGQLPNNPWDITHSDSVAYSVAKENGVDDPYSARGDSLLTAKFLYDIESKPIAYSEKIGYNLLSSLVRGVYIGEYSNIIEKGIKIIFILIFDLLLLMTCIYLVRQMKRSFILSIVLTFILYKFALITLVQYEPRHMNTIYLFLFGTALLFLNNRKSATPRN